MVWKDHLANHLCKSLDRILFNVINNYIYQIYFLKSVDSSTIPSQFTIFVRVLVFYWRVIPPEWLLVSMAEKKRSHTNWSNSENAKRIAKAVGGWLEKKVTQLMQMERVFI